MSWFTDRIVQHLPISIKRRLTDAQYARIAAIHYYEDSVVELEVEDTLWTFQFLPLDDPHATVAGEWRLMEREKMVTNDAAK